MRFEKISRLYAVLTLAAAYYPATAQAGGWSMRIENPQSHYPYHHHRRQPVTSFNYGPLTFFSYSHGPVTSFNHSYGPVTSMGHIQFSNRYPSNENRGLYRYPESDGFHSPAERFKQRNDYFRGYRQGYLDGRRDSRR